MKMEFPSRDGLQASMSAYSPISSALPPCVDGSPLARVFLTVMRAGRCCHVFGLLMRRCSMAAGHNALRRSGPAQKHAVSLLHGGKWVVLIIGTTGWVHYPSVALSNFVSANNSRAYFSLPLMQAPGKTSHGPSSPRPCGRSCWPERWRRSSLIDAAIAC